MLPTRSYSWFAAFPNKPRDPLSKPASLFITLCQQLDAT
jgi:hypothetical protein